MACGLTLTRPNPPNLLLLIKMKHLFITLSVLMLAAGCSKNIDKPESPVHFAISAAPAASQFGNMGGDVEITVESNYPWTASITPGVDWVEFDPKQISTGDGNSVEKTEISVVVARNDRTTERNATITFYSKDQTRTFTLTQAASFVDPGVERLGFTYLGSTQTIAVESNLTWEAKVEFGPDVVNWCTVTRDGNSLTFTAIPNDEAQKRTATLVFTTDVETISVEVPMTQFSLNDNYADKEIVRLQKATTGKGINIVMMGEGYTLPMMARDGGKYETDMKAAVEFFFSIYPYSAYREYFNIWMIAAISNEEGMSVQNPMKNVDTVFKSAWAGGGSTMLSCDTGIAKTYAQLVAAHIDATPGGTGTPTNVDEMLAIMPVNFDLYAGTCYMNPGFSVAMCPVSLQPGEKSFKNITIHETCGHGFAKLADEYLMPGREERTIPTPDKLEIDKAQRNDEMQLNLSVTGDITKSPWAGMAGNPKYTGENVAYNNRVGIFEGAGYYGKGLWRSEPNSCMNDNVLYFSAVSRWSAVRKIMKLSGVDDDYTVEEFMANDVIPVYPAAETRVSSVPFVPLGRPITEAIN